AAGPVEHPPKTLRVREGATFELRIPMAPRPGFAWNVKVSGNVKILEEGYLAGNQPRHRVKLRAKLAGEGAVRCTFGRPWDNDPAEVRTYVVQIVPSHQGPERPDRADYQGPERPDRAGY
ncbi:MAG: protease inhibitor I42 family protein, partial [Actinomycetota bacterium]|nr:protease inhibitor I42 family protein [Actinomycetota bacterium]